MSDLIASLIDDQSLASAVKALARSSPEADQVLTRLLTHFQHKLLQQQEQYGSTLSEPNAKRMRLDGSSPFSSSTPSSPATAAATVATLHTTSAPTWPVPASKDLGPAIYSTGPVSFLHPFRKKLALRFHQKEVALVQSPTATSPTEVVLAAAPWTALYRVIAVPFLERATKQTAVLLFFRHEAVPTPKDAIWAVTVADDGKDFALTCATEHLGLLDLTTDLRDKVLSKRPDAVLVALITQCLEVNNHISNNNNSNNDNNNNSGYEIVANQSPPFPNFSAHLKSSQGTIYLLPKGILFAFKKPIIYLPATKIDAIGFHSIVSRTFDVEIVVSEDASPEDCEGVPPSTTNSSMITNTTTTNHSGGNSNTSNSNSGRPQSRRSIGFGMIDTKEFAKLEDWIKRSGIRDRSMSEDLKAKDKAPISSKKRERIDGDDDDGEGGDDNYQGSDEEGNDVKKAAMNGVKLDKGNKGKGKAVVQQHRDDDSDDDEDDEDFAPESEDEDMVEEYDSEAIGSDNDDHEMESATTTTTAAAAASASSTRAPASTSSSAGSSRHRAARQEEDDGESLGEDTDEDDEEDDELEEEEEEEEEEDGEDEEEKDEVHAAEDAEDEEEEDEDENAANNEQDDQDSVDLGAEGDEDGEGPAEEDEEELRSDEGEEMEEDDIEDVEDEEEEDEIDELEDD
ncbi:hypothetical protein DFQ27_000848 [Actinomortierella ambigua]|uniref:Histone chaperone RTT106/FACT complex subunit SPT16-like middle domain-containing protein n=1 Tax=Actinomortierella ambigua TaxID=1343610 RepID=A0A9P6U8E9_9FUNG|nr:hypothetical protein DFQ27_000848 [Actinomortierella ambigua]